MQEFTMLQLLFGQSMERLATSTTGKIFCFSFDDYTIFSHYILLVSSYLNYTKFGQTIVLIKAEKNLYLYPFFFSHP